METAISEQLLSAQKLGGFHFLIVLSNVLILIFGRFESKDISNCLTNLKSKDFPNCVVLILIFVESQSKDI